MVESYGNRGVRMTEKRFRTGKGIVCGDYFSETIIDTENNEKYYGGIKPNYISSKEIVKLLNQLHEENKSLKFDKTNLHRTMGKDRVQYNQFKDKVFCCLDSKIKLLKDCCMSNEVKILEELREEIIRND